jgi:hypothetical protein
MKTVSSLALGTAICVVIFWVFMALRPANAQREGGNYMGGYFGDCRLPNCAVDTYRRPPLAAQPRPNKCMYRYIMAKAGKDARVDRLAAETTRRGGTTEAAATLSGTHDYQSVQREAKRACGVRW